MLNGVNKEVISVIQRRFAAAKRSRYRRSSEVREKEDYKLSKDEVPNSEIVKLVKHNNDKLLKLLKGYAKINRNDTVTIQNVANGQTQEMKYKKAEKSLANGLL
jgi:preprotein translocase subunit SecA